MINKNNIVEQFDSIRDFIKTHLQIDSVELLGSGRRILNEQLDIESKDLDILIETDKSVQDIKTILDKISKNYPEFNYKNYFGNVISIQFNDDQFDLIVSNSKLESGYLSKIRFYSNETKPLKGLHRTELLRSFLKLYGFSFGATSIIQYKLTTNDRDCQLVELLDKAKRMRDITKKNKLINFISDFIKNGDNLPYRINNRYWMFDYDSEIIDIIKDCIYDKENINYKHVLNYVGLTIKDTDNFNSLLDFILNKKLQKSDLICIFDDYKQALKSKNQDYYQAVKKLINIKKL